MNALIYTRGQGLSEQVTKCKAYAEKMGYKVTAWATEGDDLSQYVGNLDIDVLLVASPSRIGRTVEKYLMMERILSWHGVSIEIAE